MLNETNLARVKLVTGRYWELQGLRYVVVGLAFVAAFALFWALRPITADAVFIALGAAIILMVPGMLLVDRYYRTHFGRVAYGDRGTRKALLFGVAIGVAMQIERVAVGETQMLTPFLLNAALFLRTGVRDWPLRRYHLLGAAGAALAAVIQLTPAAAADPHLAIGAAFLLLGVAAIPVGLLDHQLLATTMRHGEQPVGDTPHA